MRKFLLAAAGIAVSSLVAWEAINFHIFRTDDGFITALKRQPTLADTYVDVRAWSVVEWSEFPDLAWAYQRAGRCTAAVRRPVVETARRVEVDVER